LDFKQLSLLLPADAIFEVEIIHDTMNIHEIYEYTLSDLYYWANMYGNTNIPHSDLHAILGHICNVTITDRFMPGKTICLSRGDYHLELYTILLHYPQSCDVHANFAHLFKHALYSYVFEHLYNIEHYIAYREFIVKVNQSYYRNTTNIYHTKMCMIGEHRRVATRYYDASKQFSPIQLCAGVNYSKYPTFLDNHVIPTHETLSRLMHMDLNNVINCNVNSTLFFLAALKRHDILCELSFPSSQIQSDALKELKNNALYERRLWNLIFAF
jgi:hypothetical protein